MRPPLIACAAAVPLVPGAGAAAAAPASAGTTDTLLCTGLSYPLVNGVWVLFDAQLGQPYEAPLSTSNEDGGTFTVTGTAPPGMRVPHQYGATGTILGGTPTQQGTFTFTLPGYDFSGGAHPASDLPGDGRPAATADPVVLPGSGPALLPGTVGTACAQSFPPRRRRASHLVSSLGAFATWALAGVHRRPTGNNNQPAGTPATTGTVTFTMRVAAGQGDRARQQFSFIIQPRPRHHR